LCGIVGLTSPSGVVRSTLHRLARLEYRGYDSYGVAVLPGDPASGVTLSKDVGSIGRALEAGRFDDLPDGTVALAHTRWATHGAVSVANAHPHLSYDRRVAVVHNGVIENHTDLRRQLEATGVRFASETDSEVVAHLIAARLADGQRMPDALLRTVDDLVGEFALGVVFLAEPDTLYGAKRKSPLLVAAGDGVAVLASDQMATFGVGRTVTHLDDGDIVRLTPGHIDIQARGEDGKPAVVTRAAVPATGHRQPVDKAGHPHFMIKEIHETPVAAATALAIPAEQFDRILPAGRDRRVALVGAGSAYYVAQLGQYHLMELAGLTAHAYPSDEAEYLAPAAAGDTLIAISQSGETFDTLEVCRQAVDRGAPVVSISNVPGSTQERLGAASIQQGSGPEICVLSTKSIVSQVLILSRLALEQGRRTGALSDQQHAQTTAALQQLPQCLTALLAAPETIQEIAKKYSHVEDWFFIGRGNLYPAALESALKFKEVSYRHAEGMAAGFFKHGTISLIDEDFHTVALLPSKIADPQRFHATLASVSEIAARGGPVIGIGPGGLTGDDLQNFADYIPLPYQHNTTTDVVVQLVAGQLLAYYCALDLGREIDQPRSLAKSVTVR